jgi:hypothetical protein
MDIMDGCYLTVTVWIMFECLSKVHVMKFGPHGSSIEKFCGTSKRWDLVGGQLGAHPQK